MSRGPRSSAPGALALALVLVLGLALVLLPGSARTTGAVLSDAADTTTSALATGPFVPAAANAVTCSTSGSLLNPASVITFSTPLVTAPPRGTVEYVVRIFRVDVTPQVQIGQTLTMNVGATTATASWSGGGLTLLENTSYQARVTTRLANQTLESSPIRTRSFTNTGLLIANFVCGTGT